LKKYKKKPQLIVKNSSNSNRLLYKFVTIKIPRTKPSLFYIYFYENLKIKEEEEEEKTSPWIMALYIIIDSY